MVRAIWPWKKSMPPRWRIAPRVPASSGWISVVPSAVVPPKMRRASRSPRVPPADCRSRDRARDTGTPKRASRSAGATVASQRSEP
jgi:hypothetical protein